jgi:hypothetical protein
MPQDKETVIAQLRARAEAAKQQRPMSVFEHIFTALEAYREKCLKHDPTLSEVQINIAFADMVKGMLIDEDEE